MGEYGEYDRLEDLSGSLMSSLQDEKTKALVIHGEAGSGKTTLAFKMGNKAARELDAQTFFTTAQIQNTLGARNATDKSGVTYSKLPSPDTLAKTRGMNIIIVDEISQRTPDLLGSWGKYARLPNTKFVLITHPNNRNLSKWTGLFAGSNVSNFYI